MMRSAARSVRTSRYRANAQQEGGEIVCGFFPLVYLTTRIPQPEETLINFGVVAAEDNALSFDIILNDVVMETAIPSGDASWVARGTCVGSRYCYQTDLLRPQASDDADSGLRGFRVSKFAATGDLDTSIAAMEQEFADILEKPIPEGSEETPPPPRAIVMIHGFNTEFSEAVDALTNLMITARYPGTPYLLSWPSQGRLIFSGSMRALRIGLNATYEVDRNAVT